MKELRAASPSLLCRQNPGVKVMQIGKWQAILLLGPTGSGKTPLGEWLQTHGLQGKRCCHFDFGANLRQVVEAGPARLFSLDELAFLKSALATGVLLENESFYLAARILADFVAHKSVVQPEDLLVLNGVPRHVGQARSLAAHVSVKVVIQLECSPSVARERLRRDTGGDRVFRADDAEELVARKLAIYEERTRPLAGYYRDQGARIISVPVEIGTAAEEAGRQLERQISYWPNRPDPDK